MKKIVRAVITIDGNKDKYSYKHERVFSTCLFVFTRGTAISNNQQQAESSILEAIKGIWKNYNPPLEAQQYCRNL